MRWVEESLGADKCVDYKSASFKEDLIKATEGFVEVYIDNVGRVDAGSDAHAHETAWTHRGLRGCGRI